MIAHCVAALRSLSCSERTCACLFKHFFCRIVACNMPELPAQVLTRPATGNSAKPYPRCRACPRGTYLPYFLTFLAKDLFLLKERPPPAARHLQPKQP